MGHLRRLTAPLLFLCAAATAAEAADPFITVKPDPAGGNSAFWILPMESRPTGNMVGDQSLEQINAALARNEPRWCAAEALTAESFTSPDPGVRAEISRYLGGANLFQTLTEMTGRQLRAVVGNVRTCAGATVPFFLLVDHRAHVTRIIHVRTFADWQPFIAMRAVGNRLVFSSCLECDHAEVLSWNRRTRRFVWRSEGL